MLDLLPATASCTNLVQKDQFPEHPVGMLLKPSNRSTTGVWLANSISSRAALTLIGTHYNRVKFGTGLGVSLL